MSVAKLDHANYSNGTLYNQKFLPNALAGDEGLKRFASVVRAYFDHKGMHVQFNVIDRATLLAAQERPEDYKDLGSPCRQDTAHSLPFWQKKFRMILSAVQNRLIVRFQHNTVKGVRHGFNQL